MEEYIQRLVDIVAKSLVEGFLVQQGEDLPQESKITKLEDSYDHLVLVTLIQERLEGSSNATVEEIIEKAKTRASDLLPSRLAEQEAEASVAPKPNSASIFLSQLNGGGALLDGFVTWERIQEEEKTDEGKLERLQTIQYVDDILPDWVDLRPFLAQFETLQLCTLYRTWFGKARSTNTLECQMFQKDMTADLFKVAVSSTSSREVSCTSLQYAVEMFIDLVDRSIPDCFLVGTLLWRVILTNPRDLLRVVVDCDPYATSFSLWFSANDMTVEKLLELLTRVTIGGNNPHSDVSVLLELVSSLDPSTHDKQFYFLLGLLHSIINCTRVIMFPWEKVRKIDLADVFRLFLQGASTTTDSRHFSVYLDALDTIERGIQNQNQRLQCRDHFRSAAKQLHVNSTREPALRAILDRLSSMQ